MIDRCDASEPRERAAGAERRGARRERRRAGVRGTPSPPGRIVGVGANSLDLVYCLPAYPQPEGPLAKLRIASHDASPGGQTVTALATCAALGLRTSYVGALSTDAGGQRLHDALTARGIDVQHVVRRAAPNAYAVILIAEGAGERIVLWDRDAGLALTPADLPADAIATARLVHVDDVDIEASIRAAEMARAEGVPVTSDIEAVTPRTTALVDAVSLPIFAEHVPAALTGEPDLERALRAIRRRHTGWLCATLGARGAVLLDGDRFIEQPAFTVAAVDTTGAGDVFRGAFIYAFLRGDAPAEVLRFACAAAAVSCTRRGAVASAPSLDDVEALLRQHPSR
ncbi:MAG TPA: PfkB family carbohydrate kinase [Vicinamibacterales bacterium]|nr:PfkB family carbohydrate kinase [Vicinamibacterales bacterium]